MKRECKLKTENIALNFTFPVKVEKIAPPPSAKGQKHPDAPAYAGRTKKPPARAVLHGSGAMGFQRTVLYTMRTPFWITDWISRALSARMTLPYRPTASGP